MASWSVRYVELRDPAKPTQLDPNDPFTGYFMVANDAKGNALFFDTMALTDDGVAHVYFSLDTDEEGRYRELPLVAAAGDAVPTRLDPPAPARVRGRPNRPEPGGWWPGGGGRGVGR